YVLPGPDDHFTAAPNCCVMLSGSGRVRGAGGCPTIRARIVSPTSIGKVANPAPDDHFTAGPDCRVKFSCGGRVGGAGGRPRVGVRIVSATVLALLAIRRTEVPTPHDHFTAGPHCRVIESASGRVGGADSCPTIRARTVS